MRSLRDDDLATIHGGIDWSAAHEKGKLWGGVAAPIGGAIGATAWGIAAGWPGVLFGGVIGTKAGLGLGYAAGGLAGMVGTWDQ